LVLVGQGLSRLVKVGQGWSRLVKVGQGLSRLVHDGGLAVCFMLYVVWCRHDSEN
jgi:hypothetical protein